MKRLPDLLKLLVLGVLPLDDLHVGHLDERRVRRELGGSGRCLNQGRAGRQQHAQGRIALMADLLSGWGMVGRASIYESP